jgi:NADPH:quinone reductase-like Zn-dependent oxidoreductase
MRRIICREYGDPAEVLKQIDVPVPSPRDGQVLVNITVRPVHSGDLLTITGRFDPERKPIPAEGFIPGYEGAGIIEAVGPGLDPERGLTPGTRVAFFGIGACQDKIVLPADSVMLVPPDLTDDLAAQLHVNPLTALLITRLVLQIAGNRSGIPRLSAVEPVVTERDSAGDQPGVVLLSAAGSAVAKLVATMLGEKGITTIGMVRSRATAAALRNAAMAVVVTDDADWQDQVRAAAGERPIFAALDAVGGQIASEMLGLLSPGGTLVTYGALSGEPLVMQQLPLWMQGKVVRGIGMIHWAQLPYENRAADIAFLIEFIGRHRHLFRPGSEFPLSQIADAMGLFSKPGRDGAILLRS